VGRGGAERAREKSFNQNLRVLIELMGDSATTIYTAPPLTFIAGFSYIHTQEEHDPFNVKVKKGLGSKFSMEFLFFQTMAVQK
jgi:hypothetical protein